MHDSCPECSDHTSFTILDSEIDFKTCQILKRYLVGEVEKYIDFIFVGNTGIDTGKYD